MRGLFALMLFAVVSGCSGDDAPVAGASDHTAFRDIIDHHGAPAAAEDWSIVPFSDRGAWFGFALPPAGRDDLAGGFAGPFLMTNGRWVSPQLARLDVAGAVLDGSVGLPGRLVTSATAGDLRVTQSLHYDVSATALVRTRMLNRGDAPRVVAPVWTGSVFAEAATIEATDAGVLVRATDGSRVRLRTLRPVGAAGITDGRYRLPLATPVTIAPGDSVVLLLAVSMVVAGDVEPDLAAVLATAEKSRQRSARRWAMHVDAVTGTRASGDPVAIVAVKALQTMVNNWRGPAGRFRHGGLFPSSNVGYFNGFWAWDSWKHAVGLAQFDTDIAAGQLRIMFDQQDESGMIADVVYLDPDEDNWRDTKPPLAAWALEVVFGATDDLGLVRDLYPRLRAYHEFWYAHRDHDGDGLCEYGSTDGTLVAARWESGMDNAVRFDHAAMLRNGARAWSMDQESVDLNSYLYGEKIAMAHLAEALGDTAEAARRAREAERLRERIRSEMFDEESGWYYDIDIDGGAFVPVQGPEGWIPLWAGVATDGQAARLRSTMLDSTKFMTHVPFPTVARDDPAFSDGYWRGLVWLDQVYFAIEGLRRYGYGADADMLTERIFAALEGVAEAGVPLRENYDPLTGEGRNVKHFSWTAAHLLLLAR